MLIAILFHVFVASLCRYMFIGSNSMYSCNVLDDILSNLDVFVINLSALF